MKAKITLDPAKKPKTIDFQMTDAVNKGRCQLGIYELDGDTLKSCFAAPAAERPRTSRASPATCALQRCGGGRRSRHRRPSSLTGAWQAVQRYGHRMRKKRCAVFGVGGSVN